MLAGPLGSGSQHVEEAPLSERDHAMAQLVTKVWTDEAFNAALTENPRAALRQVGIDVPAELEIEVVQNTAQKVYLVIPRKPDGELSEGDLERVAAGYGAQDVHRTTLDIDWRTKGSVRSFP